MADSPASGIQLAQQSRDPHAIERVPTAVAAFIGRTLKGPVNQALTVRSFPEFQQHFGGLWQPSTLGYAGATAKGTGIVLSHSSRGT